MYNRYIPQSDGSYHRRPVPSNQAPPGRNPPPPPKDPPKPAPPPPPRPEPRPQGTGSFLRQLLPREFDTGDLLIVLLLLLMAGDGETDKGDALLTLALYFLM